MDGGWLAVLAAKELQTAGKQAKTAAVAAWIIMDPHAGL
jgi:hypothetical protein